MWFRRNRESEEPSLFDLARAPLIPIPLFKFRFSLCKCDAFPLTKRHHLPDLTYLNGSVYHTPVYIGWSNEGIFLELHTDKSSFDCRSPSYKEGDAFEFLFDTRDNKNVNYPTSFVISFFFILKKLRASMERRLRVLGGI